MPSGLKFKAKADDAGNQPIAYLPTAITAFVGRTLRGPVNRPVAVHNFADFQRTFGGLWQPSTLSYAVEQFFDNGGREALIVRAVNGAQPVTLTLEAGGGKMILRALQPGTREFLRACVDYDNIAAENTEEFNLTIQRVRVQGTQQVDAQEIFRTLSVRPGSKRFLADALADSALVALAGTVPPERPTRTVDAASGLPTGYVNSNSDGDDGAPLTNYDLIGSSSDHTGLFALRRAESFNFLCLPPLSREEDVGPSALLVAARFCKQQRALLIVDPPLPWHTVDEALRGLRDHALASEDALMYFPRILAHDKLRGRFETFAPCGAVAGLLARQDEQFPVWSGARAEEPVLRPGFRPSCLVADDRRARLAAGGVNTLQSVRSAVRGLPAARTLAGASAGATDWQFLASRRFALFVVSSIIEGTRWIAFAPTPAALASQVERQVREFFARMYRGGVFAERSEAEAFLVICDRRINSEEDDRQGRFQLVIGFAAVRPGEFHVYRITHGRTGTELAPVTLNRLKQAEDYGAQQLRRADHPAGELRT